MFIVCPGLTAQSNWSGGNLSKISEVLLDISVVGLEDPMWKKKVEQIALLFLDRYKLKINPDRFSPGKWFYHSTNLSPGHIRCEKYLFGNKFRSFHLKWVNGRIYG